MNVYNPSDHSLEQSLKFVGRQSLEDVQRSIYCLHDQLPYHETCNRSKAIEFIKDQGVSTLPSLPASLFVINEAIYTDHPEDYHFVQDNDGIVSMIASTTLTDRFLRLVRSDRIQLTSEHT